MKAEFLRDSNNNVWFSYAYDIQIRRMQSNILNPDFRPENLIQSMAKFKDFEARNLREELDQFAEAEDQESSVDEDLIYLNKEKPEKRYILSAVNTHMTNHFNQIKASMGEMPGLKQPNDN